MSVRLTLLSFFALAFVASSVFGQGSNLDGRLPTRFQPVTPASYSLQDKDTAEETLDEKLQRMELRLRELEEDVAKKVAAASEGNSGGDSKLASRIESLEKALEKQEKAVDKVGSVLPGLVYHGHKNPKMQFFGRIHLDYWSFPKVDDTLFPLELGGDPQDRFNFRRMRIGVKGDLTDNMFYKYEGEFAGGDSTSYRDAIIGFKEVPFLNTVIFGNHKRPYGLDHLNSSRHNVFIERPFIVEAFNQDSRRMGISSNGVSEDQSWNWRFGYWNQVLTQIASGYIGDKYQGEFAARIAKTAWYDESSGGRGWAHFAVAGSAGAPDGFGAPTGARYRTRPEARSTSRWLNTGNISGANANYLVGLETAFNVGQFNFTGEYMRVNVDRLDSVGEDVALEGYYGQVSYFLTGEHRVWERKTGTLGRVKPLENFFTVRDCDCNIQRGWGAWEVAARYSYADLTDQDVIGGEGESLTIGLNWYWNSYARMQFNYIIGDIDQAPAGAGDYEIFGVRMMVDF